MKVTITSLELRSPFKFFPLSLYALRITRQLKTSAHVAFKSNGVWTMHYTMTLWNNEVDLKKFAAEGAHLDAMKKSKSIAKEIRTLTVDADKLPDWKTAKTMLKQDGKVIKF